MAAIRRTRSPLMRLLCHLAVAAMLLSSASHSAARVRRRRYPKCPLTGFRPVKQSNPKTRCVDAAHMSCCSQCTDIKQALGMASANFSNFVQWLSLPPSNLTAVNKYLKGEDASMCTEFNLQAPFLLNGLNNPCSTDLEQLACAMSCHPRGGDFIRRASDGVYDLRVCLPFYFQIASDCSLLPLPRSQLVPPQVVGLFMSNGLQLLMSFGDVAWGLSGLPSFRVTFVNGSGLPHCWPGPPATFSPVSLCCDTLNTTGCPPNVVNFTANPGFAKVANDGKAGKSCRVGSVFKRNGPIVKFSPPCSSPPPPKKK